MRKGREKRMEKKGNRSSIGILGREELGSCKSRRMCLLEFCRSQAVMTRAFAGRAKLTSSQNQSHPLEICREQIWFGWTWNLVSRSVSSLGLSNKIWESMFGTDCHLPLASSCLQKSIPYSTKKHHLPSNGILGICFICSFITDFKHKSFLWVMFGLSSWCFVLCLCCIHAGVCKLAL